MLVFFFQSFNVGEYIQVVETSFTCWNVKSYDLHTSPQGWINVSITINHFFSHDTENKSVFLHATKFNIRSINHNLRSERFKNMYLVFEKVI